MANIRKEPLANDEYYHIFTRSIAKYVVFNDQNEFRRMLELISVHRFSDFDYKYSQFNRLSPLIKQDIIKGFKHKNKVLVEIVAYCIMPTHIHLLLKQVADNGITKYMGRILNSYSKYFNTKHQRTGPLWASNFKNVLIPDDEQFLHLTRYIHLNPSSAGLVKKPEKWEFSSYHEYINSQNDNRLCDFKEIIDMNSKQYQKFVNDRIDYQKKLSLIKNILLDNYSG